MSVKPDVQCHSDTGNQEPHYNDSQFDLSWMLCCCLSRSIKFSNARSTFLTLLLIFFAHRNWSQTLWKVSLELLLKKKAWKEDGFRLSVHTYKQLSFSSEILKKKKVKKNLSKFCGWATMSPGIVGTHFLEKVGRWSKNGKLHTFITEWQPPLCELKSETFSNPQ